MTSLPMAGGWNEMIFEVPPNSNHSVIFLTKVSVQPELYSPECHSLVSLVCQNPTIWTHSAAFATWSIFLASLQCTAKVQSFFPCTERFRVLWDLHLQMFSSPFPGLVTGSISVLEMSWGQTDFKKLEILRACLWLCICEHRKLRV